LPPAVTGANRDNAVLLRPLSLLPCRGPRGGHPTLCCGEATVDLPGHRVSRCHLRDLPRRTGLRGARRRCRRSQHRQARRPWPASPAPPPSAPPPAPGVVPPPSGAPTPRLPFLGTGYLGPTSAICFADLGSEGLGVDVDADKTPTLAAAEPPSPEPGLDDLL